jgi:hypothetical protein
MWRFGGFPHFGNSVITTWNLQTIQNLNPVMLISISRQQFASLPEPMGIVR